MDKLNISVEAGNKILASTTNSIASKVDEIVDEVNKTWKGKNAFLIGSTTAAITIHKLISGDAEGVTHKVAFTDYAYLGLGADIRYFNRSFEVTTTSTHAAALWKLMVNKEVVWEQFKLGNYGAFTPNVNQFVLTYYSDNTYPDDKWECVIVFDKSGTIYKKPDGLYNVV